MVTHAAFGLRLDSEIALPELLSASGPAEVSIRYGEPSSLLEAVIQHGGCYLATATDYLLDVRPLGRFQVRGGSEITVAPAPHADPRSVRSLLLNVAFGALLHQRGLLVFLGSALATPRGALLLLGNSGSGKSTVAALLAQGDCRLLADGLCAVRITATGGEVLPGIPGVLLWQDALHCAGIDSKGIEPARPGVNRYRVFQARSSDVALPLAAVCELVVGSQPRPQLEVLRGLEKSPALIDSSFARICLGGLSSQGPLFEALLGLARRLPVRRLHRPDHGNTRVEMAALLAAELAA